MTYRFSNKTSKTLFWLIFAAYTVSYIGRKAYGACMSEIRLTLDFDTMFAGYISTGYLLCYGIGQIVSGFLADKVNPSKMIGFGLFGAGVFTIMAGFSVNPMFFLLFWCLHGCSQSMLWASTIFVLLIFFSKSAILSAILFALACALMGGVNNELLTFIPLHFSKVGSSGLITGFYNSCSYIAAALSGIIAGGILQTKSWLYLLGFWTIIAAIGIPICLIGAKQWDRGKCVLEENV